MGLDFQAGLDFAAFFLAAAFGFGRAGDFFEAIGDSLGLERRDGTLL